MYRAALRSAPRIASPLRQSPQATTSRRFASTVPADRKRGFKSSVVRWGLAIGAVYWYSTSSVFAEEPAQLQAKQPPPQFSDEDLPTVEAVIAQKRAEAEARLQKAALESKVVPESETAAPDAASSPNAPVKDVEATETANQGKLAEGSPQALEEEAGQQGAFNPETGEINWDCPCLGGMADGPCGEEFKAAFSCFVYSTEEPKGMDCIDKFQHMQDCFRLHPEIYGEELADDDEASSETAVAKDLPEDSVTPAAQKQSTPEPPQTAAATETSTVADAEKPKAQAVSYAAAAASGPKQTPEEAAAPQPPQIIPSETASTSSLIDVDTPSVRTVPSDFLEQDIKTETQAARVEMEDAAARARAEADLAKKKSAKKARETDDFLTKFFGNMSDGASAALVTTNVAAVAGISVYLGYKALGLYEHGRLTWQNIGIGAGIALGVGAFEAVFSRYVYQGKKNN
ncbi:hypothetical protein F5Y16DRAFT_394387 [Xylariaceae sp. FL0255]|nr:hypothetical protein F5Y16DRAFT_394387 [Xylariaceae sp. FL0255]